MKEKLTGLTDLQISAAQKWADRFLEKADASRELSRTFVHVDMDMFFAASAPPPPLVYACMMLM